MYNEFIKVSTRSRLDRSTFPVKSGSNLRLISVNRLSLLLGMDSQREIWKALQGLKIGSDGDTWEVHQDVQKEFDRDHRLCLVVRGLNPEHQNPAGIKVTLPKA